MKIKELIKSLEQAACTLYGIGPSVKIENGIEPCRIYIRIKNGDGMIYSESYSYDRIRELLVVCPDVTRLGVYIIGAMLKRARMMQLIY